MTTQATHTETGAGAQYVTLKKGCGYWDVTNYPRGGCFRRAAEDMPGRVVSGPANLYGAGMEYSVTWEDGGSAVIPARGIIRPEAEGRGEA
jgi:hypothetical protein